MHRSLTTLPVTCLVVSIRCKSSSRWVSRHLYGSNASPLFGLWNTNQVNDEKVRESSEMARALYCKALIHASGGGRLARDWVAGVSAIACPSEALLCIALKHDGTEQDVERYREHLLGTLCTAARERQAGGPDSKNIIGSSSAGDDAVPAKPSPLGEGKINEDLVDAENVMLGNTPEVRCFVYDAMRAACFHRYHKVPEEERQRLYAVARRLGVDGETTRNIWRLVEKEGAIEREKQRALDYPWSD